MRLSGPYALQLKNVAYRRVAGAWLLHDIQALFQSGSVTRVLSADPQETRSLLRIAAGQLAPSSGSVGLVAGGVSLSAKQAQQATSAVFGLDGIFPELSILDNLFLGRPGWRFSRGDLLRRADAMFGALGVNWRAHQSCGILQERDRYVLALARCLVQDAKVYIIDGLIDHIAPGVLQKSIDYLRPVLADGGVVISSSQGHCPEQDWITHVHCLRNGRTVFAERADALTPLQWPILVADTPLRASQAVSAQFERLLTYVRNPQDFANAGLTIVKTCLSAREVHCAFIDHEGKHHFTKDLAQSGLAGAVIAVLDQARLGKAPLGEYLRHDGQSYELIPFSHGSGLFGLLLLLRIDYTQGTAESTCIAEFSKHLQAFIHDEELSVRVKQAQRLDTLGSMASSLIHDFNNTLCVIEAAAELLSFTMTDAAASRPLQAIREATHSASALTERLLSFSRRDVSAMSRIDAHQIIVDAVVILRGGILRTVELDSQLLASQSMVLGDAVALKNSLVNLGLNAGQAIDKDHGRIVFSTSNVLLPEGSLDLRGALMHSPCIKISVRDTGCGMTPDILHRIFDPFFTTRGEQGGTGLGMSVVYNTIKEHRGMIEAFSQPDQGTDIVIHLPLAGAGDESAYAIGKAQSWHPEDLLILLCDDNKVLSGVLVDVLQAMGFSVIESHSGAHCIELYRQQSEAIDLVILDHQMPGMSGSECFHQLQAINPQVRAIMQSGYAAQANVHELLATGLRGFYSKPITPVQLREAIIDAFSQG